MSIIRDALFGFGAIVVFISIPIFFLNWVHALATASVGVLIMAALWRSYGQKNIEDKKDEH